jgi:oligoendopeptidase F
MLMHEAGHAAHFANIKQPSPSSVKNAPTSVAVSFIQ